MNWLKDKLEKSSSVSGIWLGSGSAVAAEMAAAAGFDWALLDLEHGLFGESELLGLFHALARTGTAPVVRVPSGKSDLIKKALDYGASGIMVPMISRAEEAAAFVAALRYPPAGIRGLTRSSRAAEYGGDFPDYFRRANERLTGIVQIETAQGVEQADAIAATEGVDVLFIGHSDLSLALGCFEDFSAPAMQAAEARVLAACVRHGKKAGLLLRAGMSPAEFRKKGFSLMALGSDIGCLKQGFQNMLREGATQ
jgi:2-keto-3-deoxy-L-rhamnonate aldolase RhmA